jgi:hypothetical protein
VSLNILVSLKLERVSIVDTKNQKRVAGGSQLIGRQADKVLRFLSPDDWILKYLDGDTDFGVGCQVQLKNKNGEIANSFYLQLKRTTNPKYNNSQDSITQSFKVKTLNLYREAFPHVMLAVVDLRVPRLDGSYRPRTDIKDYSDFNQLSKGL